MHQRGCIEDVKEMVKVMTSGSIEALLRVVNTRWGGGSVGDGQSSNHESVWPGDWAFLILPIKLVSSGVRFLLFCTVDWLDVDGLSIEVGG